ncbi:MAG: hypothetical protein ACKVOU_13265 [Cytophagales bacterium]
MKLAIRNLGEVLVFSNFKAEKKVVDLYPSFSPVGAGMAIRKNALKFYINEIEKQLHTISDRKGNDLSSSGDNDIVMHVLKAGYEVGFSPLLQLTHLIPASRLTKDYFGRLNYGIMKSWTQFLRKHGICPWQAIPIWTLIFRMVKAYFTYKAWKNEVNFVNWKGACGMFEGLTA